MVGCVNDCTLTPRAREREAGVWRVRVSESWEARLESRVVMVAVRRREALEMAIAMSDGWMLLRRAVARRSFCVCVMRWRGRASRGLVSGERREQGVGSQGKLSRSECTAWQVITPGGGMASDYTRRGHGK